MPPTTTSHPLSPLSLRIPQKGPADSSERTSPCGRLCVRNPAQPSSCCLDSFFSLLPSHLCALVFFAFFFFLSSGVLAGSRATPVAYVYHEFSKPIPRSESRESLSSDTRKSVRSVSWISTYRKKNRNKLGSLHHSPIIGRGPESTLGMRLLQGSPRGGHSST